jgi:hypothetical protein
MGMTNYDALPDELIAAELIAMIPMLSQDLIKNLKNASDDSLDYAPAASAMISHITRAILCEDATKDFRDAFNAMLESDDFKNDLLTLDLVLPFFTPFLTEEYPELF